VRRHCAERDFAAAFDQQSTDEGTLGASWHKRNGFGAFKLFRRAPELEAEETGESVAFLNLQAAGRVGSSKQIAHLPVSRFFIKGLPVSTDAAASRKHLRPLVARLVLASTIQRQTHRQGVIQKWHNKERQTFQITTQRLFYTATTMRV
jgi:hypothetical protein